MAQNYLDLAPWRLYFDGSRHKHGSEVGEVIISPDGILAEFKYRIKGVCTNNEAEYKSLITGLELLLELGAMNFEIMGDSELVIEQASKEYRCVKENLIMYFVVTIRLLKKFEQVNLQHIPQKENQRANDLAQEASWYKASKDQDEDVQVREKVRATLLSPSDLSTIKLGAVDKCHFEILTVDDEGESDWRKPLVDYLRNPVGSTDRKIKYRALSYVLVNDELFKETVEGVLLKCLRESEAYVVVSSPWPFRGWALDVIGEIKPASSKQQRFGIPETITTDQGLVFTGRKVQDFAKEMGIKLLTSTPYYPQANGQVEVANKVIISLIKKHIVLPVEIQVQAVRTQRQYEIPSEDYWSMMTDELVDVDEERMLALESLRSQKEKVARAYNKKVKGKMFAVDDLVWRVILPMDRKDRVLGKWSPNWEGPFKVLQAFSNNTYEVEELAPDRQST
ncbi:uncharacterized protein LOC127122802 [Lathyrus oleraceus]|uniref:uncharacterized protein LOC127122802 n=1 Tax=Pisum sativum TaxID=3888 RepID=UPI0021D0FCD4|nr:uncharacterized protein LOC127122802 [Pisum sativum]